MSRFRWVSSIPTLCPTCGYRQGCVNRDLTFGEAAALRKLGYLLTTNVFGEDIAKPPASTGYIEWFSDALFHYHLAGHPPQPPTSFERLGGEDPG